MLLYVCPSDPAYPECDLQEGPPSASPPLTIDSPCPASPRPLHSPFSSSIAKTGPRLRSEDKATMEFLLPCNKTTNANFKLAFVCSLHRQSAAPRDVGCCVRRLSKARTCSIQPNPKSYYSSSIHKQVPLAGDHSTDRNKPILLGKGRSMSSFFSFIARILPRSRITVFVIE